MNQCTAAIVLTSQTNAVPSGLKGSHSLSLSTAAFFGSRLNPPPPPTTDGRTDGEGTVEERYKGLPSLSALFCSFPLSPYPERNATKVSDAGRQAASERASEGYGLVRQPQPHQKREGSVRAQMTSAVYGVSHNLNM